MIKTITFVLSISNKAIDLKHSQMYTPSQKVLDLIKAIDVLNRDHKAGIRGLVVNLFFRDRYTKEDCKYIADNLEPEVKQNTNKNPWVSDSESQWDYTPLQG